MTTAALKTRLPCTTGAPMTSIVIRSALAATISAIASSTVASSVSCRKRSSTE
jgi:hypothetical protein